MPMMRETVAWSRSPVTLASSEIPHSVLYAASIRLTATTFVAGISLGIMTSLYTVCMYHLIRNLVHSTGTTRRTVRLTAWITALWTFSSISTIANAYCTIYAYAWQLDYPGGPATYLAVRWNKPVPILAYVTYIVTTWLADALMLWRLIVFYHGIHPRVRGVILPFATLIYVGMIGVSCYLIAILCTGTTLYSDFSKKAAVPFFTLSVTLNVLATTCIAARLLQFKRRTENALGRTDARASPYTSTAAVLIESSSLYAAWSLAFIIAYALNSPGQFILLLTLCNVQVIAPVLIVYRVSRGLGWERTTSDKLTSAFRFPSCLDQDQTVESDTTRDQEHHSADMKIVFAKPSREESDVPISLP